MNKLIILIISIILLINISSIVVKGDEFDPSKKAEFSFYCDTDCDSDDEGPAVVTLDVGSCQSYSDHCGSSINLNIFSSYNITTEYYTFNASIPSNPQCSGGVSGYPTQTVKCGECFTFMNGTGKAELRCSGSSSLSSLISISSVFLISTLVLLISLF